MRRNDHSMKDNSGDFSTKKPLDFLEFAHHTLCITSLATKSDSICTYLSNPIVPINVNAGQNKLVVK